VSLPTVGTRINVPLVAIYSVSKKNEPHRTNYCSSHWYISLLVGAEIAVTSRNFEIPRPGLRRVFDSGEHTDSKQASTARVRFLSESSVIGRPRRVTAERSAETVVCQKVETSIEGSRI